MEQAGLKLAPIWNISTASGNLAYFAITNLLRKDLFMGLVLWLISQFSPCKCRRFKWAPVHVLAAILPI